MGRRRQPCLTDNVVTVYAFPRRLSSANLCCVTTVVCQQLDPHVGDLAGNRELALSAIEAARGADVIVLPELVTSGYVFESREECLASSLPPDALAEWGRAADGALVVGGFAERGDDGLVYNSAALVDASGVLGVYRKAHLWDQEKLFFEPGSEAPRVYDTAHGRIGVMICYDLEFPEHVRSVALEGCELLCVPTNWPVTRRPDGEHPGEVINAMAMARMNRIFVAACDRAGVERGIEWTAGTSIIDVEGWVLSTTRADVDLALARDKRFTGLADALGDRRPELYGAVVEAPMKNASVR
jgi:predicted amidohydrolase